MPEGIERSRSAYCRFSRAFKLRREHMNVHILASLAALCCLHTVAPHPSVALVSSEPADMTPFIRSSTSQGTGKMGGLAGRFVNRQSMGERLGRREKSLREQERWEERAMGGPFLVPWGGGAGGQCISNSMLEGEGKMEMALRQCMDGEGDRMVDLVLDTEFKPNGCDLQLEVPTRPSCVSECGVGEYLSADAGGALCRKCPAGTFSIGQGSVLDHFARMPPHLETFCFSFDFDAFTYVGDVNAWKEGVDCATWTTSADGTYLWSGDQQGKDFVESYLMLHVRFVRAGTLWFTFEVDAENLADGLIFRADGVTVPLSTDGDLLVSQQLVARTVTFSVSPGWHVFKWIYIKDFSVTKQPDHARIYEIGYNGTVFARSQCQECKRGSTSVEGSVRCGICPPGEVFNEDISACAPCDADHYALSGDKACKLRLPCTSDDYEARYTPCADKVMDKFWVLREPVICNNRTDNSTGRPDPSPDLPCRCGAGYYTGPSGACEVCSAGSYSSVEDSSSCSLCVEGHEAPMTREIHFREGMPTDVVFGCTGVDCGGSGWLVKDGYVEARWEPGRNAEIWLQANIEVSDHAPGSVKVFHQLPCASSSEDGSSGGLTMIQTVDSTNGQELPCRTASQSSPAELTVPSGVHVVRWTLYVRPSNTGTDARVVKIYSIELSGMTTGGARTCTACKPGYFSRGAQAQCAKCPAGKVSDPARTSCSACPHDTFARAPGAPACTPCGNNTHSGLESLDCSMDCVYTQSAVEGVVYNLSALGAGGVIGPIRMDVVEATSQVPVAHTVFMSVCQDLAQAGAGGCGMGEAGSYACSMPIRINGPDGGDAGEAPGPGPDGVSVGRVKAFEPLEGKYVQRYGRGVTLSFEGGDSCYGEGGRTWRTVVHVVCDMTVTENNGRGRPVADRADNCEYHFVWRSPHGCPLCTQHSYSQMGTACVSGYHDVSYKREVACVGGVPQPADRKNAPCSEELREVMPAWAIAALVGGLVFLAAVIGTLAYQFLKYRRLYAQYSRVGGAGGAGAAGEDYEIADD